MKVKELMEILQKDSSSQEIILLNMLSLHKQWQMDYIRKTLDSELIQLLCI